MQEWARVGLSTCVLGVLVGIWLLNVNSTVISISITDLGECQYTSSECRVFGTQANSILNSK